MNKLKLLVILFIFATSCNLNTNPPDKLFTLLDPEKTNVKFSNTLTDTEEFNIVEYLNYYNGAGIAAGDINNDGLVDLYFASNQKENKLFLNKGNFKFKDITKKAGVSCPGGWKTGVSMADINGDSFLDIYVCQVGDYKTVQGENHLYINNGDQTFSDQTEAYGLSFKGFSTQALFIDYDNDGDLDMFLLNHAIHTKKSYGRAAIIRYTRDLKTGDRLFEQIEKEGRPYFVNVTERAGIFNSRIGYGLGVASGDVNNDGCMDIYVSNDFHENDYLYINNCDGTFTERIRVSVGHTSKSSMGNDMADFNNDGLLDIFSLDMFPEDESIIKNSAGEEMMEVFKMKADLGYYYQLSRNALQLNRGNESFSEIAAYSGVYATDWSWAPLFFDADNDGLKDLFITNGIPNRPNDLDYLKFIEDNAGAINSTDVDRISNAELIEVMPSDTIANFAFRNNGHLSFTDSADSWGLGQKAFSNACVYADLDNDGDLDYVVNNINENCFIYRNNSETLTEHNFLKVKLVGPEKNTFGIGARVEIWTNGMVQAQQMVPARGAMSSVDPVLNFGLGQQEKCDSALVYWPGGSMEKLQNINSNQTLVFEFLNASSRQKKLFEPKGFFNDITTQAKGTYQHKKSTFFDYTYQNLLPHKLSGQGPKMAHGDVNGDGLIDLYVCGGAGQPGQMMIQQTDGTLILNPQPAFIKNTDAEENDAVLFDADGDGDLDLIVARGSSQHFNQPQLLTNAYYKNNGKGRFSLETVFPSKDNISSCISVHDYDNDGDLDVFIGSRPNLNQYGLSSDNTLLQNNGHGKFIDVINDHEGQIKSIGMVTDAIWSDVTGDSIAELIVVGEWMNIKVFNFQKNQFKEITPELGLENTSGWWNTIESTDIDDDGDMDLVAGNLGLNAKIKGTLEHPSILYAKDFDGNGQVDPVICIYRNGNTVPFPTRDDLIKQIPSLKNKFPTYEKYSQVRSIEDIFSDRQLADAQISQANEFRSCIFENLGNGKMEKIPLPDKAQLFPVFSILIEDINHDGIKDMLLGGNLYDAHITYGRYDAGYGLFLEGVTGLFFSPQSIQESGLYIRGEIRDIQRITTAGQELLFVTKSDDTWQILEILR